MYARTTKKALWRTPNILRRRRNEVGAHNVRAMLQERMGERDAQTSEAAGHCVGQPLQVRHGWCNERMMLLRSSRNSPLMAWFDEMPFAVPFEGMLMAASLYLVNAVVKCCVVVFTSNDPEKRDLCSKSVGPCHPDSLFRYVTCGHLI